MNWTAVIYYCLIENCYYHEVTYYCNFFAMQAWSLWVWCWEGQESEIPWLVWWATNIGNIGHNQVQWIWRTRHCKYAELTEMNCRQRWCSIYFHYYYVGHAVMNFFGQMFTLGYLSLVDWLIDQLILRLLFTSNLQKHRVSKGPRATVLWPSKMLGCKVLIYDDGYSESELIIIIVIIIIVLAIIIISIIIII